jgi:predicted secreted protein
MIPGINPLALAAGFEMGEAGILGISAMEWWILLFAVAVLVIMDIAASGKKSLPPEEMALSWGLVKRSVFITLIAIIILIFGRYGSGEEIRSFVYMQF